MPINIPALAGRLSGDADGEAERMRATFIPPHLIEQQKACARWVPFYCCCSGGEEGLCLMAPPRNGYGNDTRPRAAVRRRRGCARRA